MKPECRICNNMPKKGFGYCKNIDGKGDSYDCCDYVDESWMINWMKRLQKKYKEPYVSNFVKWSKKFLSIIVIILLCVACEDLIPNDDNDKKSIYVYINPRLPQDDNGFFHLTLNRNKWQTIHRFSGLVTDMNDNPIDVMKFKWESNLYWVLGDTLGKIIKRGLTDDMVYVSYDTTYMTGFEGEIVPTINCCSYSNSKGEFSQMTGFVRSMIGDTANVSISYYNGLKEEVLSIGIVLD